MITNMMLGGCDVTISSVVANQRLESFDRPPMLNHSSGLSGYRTIPSIVGDAKMERETGFEPATSTLARWRSTTELFPLKLPSVIT